MKFPHLFAATVLAIHQLSMTGAFGEEPSPKSWEVGTPIVSYWAGPGFPGGGDLSDAAASRLVEGGWNFVWCEEKELDVVQRHGLRGLVTSDLLTPATLDDPKRREALDAFILRIRNHPGLYAYHLVDEPGAGVFPALGRLVAYLRERDPEHVAYINLFPTYASNQQLGTTGNRVEAYNEHLRQYVETVQPELLSYDHYHFTKTGDGDGYLENLALIRTKALASGLPFMNIVQTSAWGPTPLASPTGPRVPTPDEVRFLVYTTLAYGAQGISYYVYSYPEHVGNVTEPDGTPTVIYQELKSLNPRFVAIAKELQSLKSLNVFQAGMLPPGTVPLPKKSTFSFDPPVPDKVYQPGGRVEGVILSEFGPAKGDDNAPSHVLVVNLDYQNDRTVTLAGPAPLELFDASSGKWSPANSERVELKLKGGAGKLVRVLR
ncbi:hypothetical protein V2O64_18440 [Verrucomicrobiaceae bacterium 227]